MFIAIYDYQRVMERTFTDNGIFYGTFKWRFHGNHLQMEIQKEIEWNEMTNQWELQGPKMEDGDIMGNPL